MDEQFCHRREHEHEILRCRVGSQAYGTSTPESDEDFKGIFVPHLEQLYGIKKAELSRRYSKDDTSYSLRHFALLAVKCVPNVLELLFCEAEDVVQSTGEGRRLREHRDLFLSQNCVNPYVGYAESQLRKSAKRPERRGKVRQNLVEKFGYDTKFALHTIRLLQSAKELISTGRLIIRRPNADFLISIKEGKAFQDYEHFRSYATQLSKEVREIKADSVLPLKPDIEAINDLVMGLHVDYWVRVNNSV